MNRLVFLCHVREDESSTAKSLAKALAAKGLKVTYRNVAPWPQSEEPRGVLRESVETGLLECCYGVILLSEAFLARRWPKSELAEIVSRVVGGKERLIHVRHQVSIDEVARAYPPLANRPAIFLDNGYDAVAEGLYKHCADTLAVGDIRRLARTLLNPKSLDLFECRECGRQGELALECVSAPPLGTSGVLVCTHCGRGYPIRNGVPQLLSEGAFNPDEPPPPNMEPQVDIKSLDLLPD